MTRPIHSRSTRTRLERALTATATTALLTIGLLATGAPAQAASAATSTSDAASQAEYQPTVTVTSRSANVNTPGHALITVNYQLTKDDVPGELYIAFFHGATPSDGGFIDDVNLYVTESGPRVYQVDRTLIPGDYSLRMQGKYGPDCQGQQCYGQVKLAEDLSFTVAAAPTPTPTPTNAPTPEPTATATPIPDPTASASTSSPTASVLPASASLSTSTVTPGGQVTVTGRGYAPGEAIELWLHSSTVKLASLTASPDGIFSRIVTIPEATEAGAHHIEVRGATSGTTSLGLTVVAGLAVTGADSSLTVALGGVAVLLLAAGVSVAVVRRRRTRSEGAL